MTAHKFQCVIYLAFFAALIEKFAFSKPVKYANRIELGLGKNELNILTDFRALRYNVNPTVACWACESVVVTIQTLLRLGTSRASLASEAIVVCETLRFEAQDVCVGVVKELKASDTDT